MKYLFLIMVCYAVKCEDVGNNYFVVEMPEDNRHHDVKDLKKKPFQVYWNVPTMQCASKSIPFQNLYEKFGIIQNDNDKFVGDKIAIIYNEADFPAIIYNKTSGENIHRNGGVPQEGNLEKHLIAFEKELNDKIPDPYFDGIGIIDFESWRPVFHQNFGNLVPHRHLSIKIEKQLHNWWPKMWIEKEASLRFETAARRFMQTTLSMVKELRPNALWGYYGLPHCFNMRGKDMSEKCAKNVDEENDSIYWLWAESTALFPSLYSSVSLSSSQLSSLIKGRVKETSRVRGRDTPIFPYFWFRYRDLETGFMSEKDLTTVLTTLYESKASGFIIWGSSNDVNTVEKCKKLHSYVETVLGPSIAKYTKQLKKVHTDMLENEETFTSTAQDGFAYSQNTQLSYVSSTEYNFSTEISAASDNDEMYSTESSITYYDYTNTEDSQTINNNYLSSSLSESSTVSNEYMNSNQNIQNHEEISSTEISITYNEYTNTDQSSEFSNLNNILRGENLQNLNNVISNEETLIYTDDNVQIFNDNNDIFLSESSTIYNDYTKTDQITSTFNHDESSIDTSTIYNELMNTDRSKLILNSNEISLKDVTLNNWDVILLPESLTIHDEYTNSDVITTTLNKDAISSTDTSILYSDYINVQTHDNKILSSEGTLAMYDNFDDDRSTESLNNVIYLKETSSDSDYITDAEKSTDILISEVTTENNKIELTGNDHNNNTLLSSDEDDYLIKIDNSTSVDNFKQSEYTESTNVDDDYLIIVRYINNKVNLTVNNKDNKLQADDYTEETDYDYETEYEINNKTANELDLVVKYIENKKNDQDLKSTEDLNLLNSDEDRSDYLIVVDNSTNIETYIESKHTNITNDDYLIIVRDLNNDINVKDNIEDLDTTTQVRNSKQHKFVTENEIIQFNDAGENLDLVESLQDMITPGDDDDDDEIFNNNNLIVAYEAGSEYLITMNDDDEFVETNKSTESNEQTDRVNVDNDYLIIIGNLNDKQNIDDKTVYNIKEFPTTEIESNITKYTESYDYSTTEIYQ